MQSNNIEKKWVISVAAGTNQIPLIETLKARGYGVVSFDKNENAPGKKISDEFKSLSTREPENAIKWLQSLNINFTGVGCFSYGGALLTRQKIAERFNLPARIDTGVIEKLVTKHSLRKELEKRNLSEIEEFSIAELRKKPDSKFKGEKYVLKPAEGGSSMGVRYLTPNEVPLIIHDKNVSNDHVIQEYVDGIQYRIHFITQESVLKFAAVMEQKNIDVFTCRLSPVFNVDGETRNFLKQVIAGFNVVNGAAKLDVLKKGNRFEIIDLDFMVVSGEYFADFIGPAFYGYDVINNYINLITGLNVEKLEAPRTTFSCFDYIYFTDKSSQGKLNTTKTINSLETLIGECEIKWLKPEGQALSYPVTNQDALAAVLHNSNSISHNEISAKITETLKNS